MLRAAELTGMTQPAASKMLGELEDSLGVKFFERHARGVEPTWYGEILVRHARTAMSEMDRAHDEITGAEIRHQRSGIDWDGVESRHHLIPLVIAAVESRIRASG